MKSEVPRKIKLIILIMSQAENSDKANQPQEMDGQSQHDEPKDSLDQHMPIEEQEKADPMQTPKRQTNEEYMRTMEHKNVYEKSPGGTTVPKYAKTQGSFHPRNTLHNRSTERGGPGSHRFSKLSSGWNDRFHMSPSTHNKKAHTFYKEFFSKPSRSTEPNVLKPKKFVDPYLTNEQKSRIPRYSKVYKERDFQGELNWVDNFSVTSSKNNLQVHNAYKEYFDKPVGYKGHITVATK